MNDRPFRRLTPSDELSAFHAARSGTYQAFFELLRMPPRQPALDAARRAVDGCRSAGDHRALSRMQEALARVSQAEAADEFAHLFSGDGAIGMRCKWPSCGVREAAFAAANALPIEEKVGEINVLALLSERTTQALVARHIPEAAAFSDVQGRFLALHAGVCQTELAEDLKKSQAPFYSQVGTALGWIIEDDLSLLGYPDATS